MAFTLKVKMKLERMKLLYNGPWRWKGNGGRGERSCMARLVRQRIGMYEFGALKGHMKITQIMA